MANPNLELFVALRNALQDGLTRDQLADIVERATLAPLTGAPIAETDAASLASTIAFALLPPPQVFPTSAPSSMAPPPVETESQSHPSFGVLSPAISSSLSTMAVTATSKLKSKPKSSKLTPKEKGETESVASSQKTMGPSRAFRAKHFQRPLVPPSPSMTKGSQSTAVFAPSEPSEMTLPETGKVEAEPVPGVILQQDAERLPPYSSNFSDKQKDAYFFPDAPLSDENKKYCRGVRHIAANQDAWCLENVNRRQRQKNPETGKVCYNPYAVATSRVGRSGAVSCFPHMDWTKIPVKEVEAEISLKKKKGVNTYADLLALQAHERQST